MGTPAPARSEGPAVRADSMANGEPRRLVSVIVPCYNYARFLPLCVESVLSQVGVDVRILIVDDASTDQSWDVASRLAAVDDRIEIRRHGLNRGHIRTYNEGLTWASGTYTVLLSADDLLTPGALARAVRLLERNPQVGFAYGRSLFFQTNDRLPRARGGPGRFEIWPGHDWLELRCRAAHNCISSPEVVVRTSLQHDLGGYREDLPHTGDVEMWMRFASHADVGYVAGADQAYYRVHPKSMQRGWLASPLAALQQRKTAFDAVFADHASRIPGAEELRHLANRTLAREALWRVCRAYDRRRLSRVPVEQLVDFAFKAEPSAGSLPEYRSLRWRQRLGPKICPLIQPVVLPGVLRRRYQTWLWWQGWKRHGV